MSKIFQDTTYEPTIVLDRVEGNLRVKGWDQPDVRFDADNKDALDVQQNDFKIEGHCRDNLYLRVPTNATVEIKIVHGEATFKSIEGDVRIGQIDGNTTLKLLGSAEIESVQGNLAASRIEGSLRVDEVIGNATVRDVEEAFIANLIHGNLNYRGVGKDIQCTSKGNVGLRLEVETGAKYKVQAGGNLSCKAEVATGAKVQLRSKAKTIRVKTPEGSDNFSAEKHEFTIGEGDAAIDLEAGERIDFSVTAPFDDFDDAVNMEFAEDMAFLADDITQQVTDQIEAQMSTLNDQLSQLSVQFGGASSDRAQRAAEKAQRKVERAQRKLELKLAATQRRAERQARKAGKRGKTRFAFTAPINIAKSKNEPVSDDERQAILQMLQDQKITVEEAELLLSALEGDLASDGNVPEAPTPPEAPEPPAESES
ncbi:MAG: hypothetical protein DWQ07_03185 [Chloroflexi bacterium]|nr:MAG: hypothetical protein DWQ07_03185 [Chloroflexota bacterium]MBL1193496.1 hypothetical protein [Chloroflexota bacterium]NOH10786.1 hypothetical protein [Chloroflexota bacterium]